MKIVNSLNNSKSTFMDIHNYNIEIVALPCRFSFNREPVSRYNLLLSMTVFPLKIHFFFVINQMIIAQIQINN